MLYFKTLPKILNFDERGNYLYMTNIMTRAKLKEQLESNPLLMYKYDIQEGDTPEIIAHKYYGDVYRYWIIMYVNKLLDPIWDWPLPERELYKFIDSKYMPDPDNPEEGAGIIAAQSEIYQYRKTYTIRDNITDIVTISNYSIDSNTYNSLITYTDRIYALEGGVTCTESLSKSILYSYDYEIENNESKRQIKLIDKLYVGEFESQFESVMQQ